VPFYAEVSTRIWNATRKVGGFDDGGVEGVGERGKQKLRGGCSQVNKGGNVTRYLRELRKQLEIFPPVLTALHLF
jgi:hypothetical protein